MSDKPRRFHQIALQSILFKGQKDWYFCFLKSEKIAHVLTLLTQSFSEGKEILLELSRAARELHGEIAHFAAGEISAEAILAEIFSLLSSIRLCQTNELLSKDTVLILTQEYEGLIERFAQSMHPSPFVSVDDFALPTMLLEEGPTPLALKDNVQGHLKGQDKALPKEQNERLQKILQYVKEKKKVSIKDISIVVRNCSEKTIQRELNVLIKQGLVQKIGERRWSLYIPV